MNANTYHKGRGAQHNPVNSFHQQRLDTSQFEYFDEDPGLDRPLTNIIYEDPKKVVNKVDSLDVGMDFSLNPYQGCEHGCAYCYARNTHNYWGYDAGLGFETNIIVKKRAPQLLEKQLLSPSWKPKPIVLSGNTDCYQPLEQKLKITRGLLEVFNKYKHPVGIITKNALILRDLDILEELAKDNLVKVILSITTLDDELRRILEPRTSSVQKKLEAIEKLTERGVPVGIMTAPIIPGINDHEIPQLLKTVSERGALSAAYTMVRLNGDVGEVFEGWLRANFPDRFDKVWHKITDVHGGQVNDSRSFTRMKGEGPIAQAIAQLFEKSKAQYFKDRVSPVLSVSKFRRKGNYQLFDD